MFTGLPRGHAAAPRRDVHLQPRAGHALPAHDLQGGPARRARPLGPGRAGDRRAAPARAPVGARGGLAVLVALSCWPVVARRRRRPPARHPPRARDVDGRRARPRPHAARRRPRDGAPGAAVRLLPLGRQLRPDPARADRQARREPLHRPVRRPALGRPAVDDRRAGQPAARAARPAAPAAGPHGRRGRDPGRRRRPLAQRRPAARRGRADPRARARRPGARVRRRRARTPARRARSTPRGGWPTCAAGALPTGGMVRVLPRAPADGGRRLGAGDRRPRGLRRAAHRPRAALRRRPRPRPAARRGGHGRLVRDQRLQPAPRVRRRAPARQRRLDGARRTSRSPRTPRC